MSQVRNTKNKIIVYKEVANTGKYTSHIVRGNNWSIPPTLEEWVYIIPIHGPLYTWAQYTPTHISVKNFLLFTPREMIYRAFI